MAKQKKLIVSVKLKTGDLIAGIPAAAPSTFLWSEDGESIHLLTDEKLVITIPASNILWIARGTKSVKEVEDQKREKLRQEARKVVIELKTQRENKLAEVEPVKTDEAGQPLPNEPQTEEDRELVRSVAENKQMSLSSIASHQKSIDLSPQVNALRRVTDEDGDE